MEDAFLSYSSGSTDHAGVLPPLAAKRRRTRRHRNPPAASANATSSSSASSTEESGFTDDEGMANCLILLAQGGGAATTAGKFKSKRFTEAETTAGGRPTPGFYVYECKTCNKCFPSFQALGGHRASHKKLKMAAVAAAAAVAEEDKKGDELIHVRISLSSVQKRTDVSGGKGKVHECSICGSEFTSGQALGGHMRRHRPAAEVAEEFKKEKNALLGLDLNLPAPDEDDGTSFATAGKGIVFSPAAAAALVDCHY